MTIKQPKHASFDLTRQLFQLPDGRSLGFAEYGDPQGKPLFYFHGCPSSRIEFAGLSDSTIWEWLTAEGLEWKRQESWFHEAEKHEPEFVEKRGASSLLT